MLLSYEIHETHDGEDMYEPVLRQESSDPLESVREDVATVREAYADFLRDDDMGRDELESVALLLRRKPGPPKKIAKTGARLLEKVENKLKNAANDLLRFDEESLAAVNSTGAKVDRLTKALNTVMHAREKLEEVSEGWA